MIEEELVEQPVPQTNPARPAPSQEATREEPRPEYTSTAVPLRRGSTLESRILEDRMGPSQVRYEDIMQEVRAPQNQSWMEKSGIVATKQDGAMTELGQGFVGGAAEFARSTLQTGVELGLPVRGALYSLEDWQAVNQDLQAFEGAKPFSSWGGFMSIAGQGLGTMVPTIAVGALFGKLGAVAGGSMKAAQFMSRTGTAIALQSQFLGDDIKFYRDEVGLTGPESMAMGMLTATSKTALNMLIGAERKIADMASQGLVLNALKKAGLNPALRESIQKTSREAMIAKITGNARPYFNTLKSYGLNVAGESFTEMGELFIDDMVRNHFVDKPFSSFSEYFDAGAAAIPATLMLGAFGSYRAHRNQQMVDDLLKPISRQDVAIAQQMYDPRAMQQFNSSVNRLKTDILGVLEKTSPANAQDQANVAGDILAGFALKSAMKLDRHDGKRVSPSEYIEGFRVAVARMQLDPSQVSALRNMSNNQAYDKLVEWGIIDEVDRVRKNSDAEDAAYVRRVIEQEMQAVIDPLFQAKDEQAMSAWWSSRPAPESAPVAEAPAEGVAAQEPAAQQPLVLAPEDEVRQRRVEANPTLAEKTDDVIVPPASSISPEMKRRAVTDPVIFKSGEDYYALRRLDTGEYGLVPTQALTAEEELKRREEQKARVKERAEADRKIRVRRDDAGARVGEPEAATERDLTIYQGRIFTPEGNTVEDATARNAAEVANLTKAEQEAKAKQLIDDENKPRSIKDLSLLPELLGLSDEEVRQQMAGEREETIQNLLDKLEGIRQVQNFNRRAEKMGPAKQRRPVDRPAIRAQLKSLSDLPFVEQGGQMFLPGMDRPAMMMAIDEELWAAPQQAIPSAETSINERKLPATFGKVTFAPNTINADIGGGRFDNATEYLAEQGVENVVYDPFNRDEDWNRNAAEKIAGGQADTATVNNVLNVIAEPENRDRVIRQAADAVKEDGKAYFLIYEGDKTGEGRETTKGWQENRSAQDFMSEIEPYFSTVTRKGNLIIAENPIKERPAQFMAMEGETAPVIEPREPEGGRLTGGDIISGVPADPTIGKSVKSISDYFDRLGKEAGEIDFKTATAEQNAEVESAIADMLRESVKLHPEAVGWYRENVELAMGVMQELDPDLAQPKNSFRFKLAVALTSDGNEVDSNFQMGWNVYNNWKAKNKFRATVGLGSRQSSIKEKLGLAEKFIAKLGGEEQADAWLRGKDTVGNIAKELMTLFNISREDAMDMLGGELVDAVVPRALVFGPKLGSFFNNLSGDYSTVTMDLWFMRSVGRITGTLVNKDTPKRAKESRGRLVKALSSSPKAMKLLGIKSIPKVGAKIDQLATLINRKTTKKEFRDTLNALAGGNEVRLAGNARTKILKGDRNESPSSGSERAWLRERMQGARNLLSQEGTTMEPADMQAAMWYGEKEIYHAFGYRTRRAAADYGSAAENVYQRVRGEPSRSYATSTGRVGGIGRASNTRDTSQRLDRPAMMMAEGAEAAQPMVEGMGKKKTVLGVYLASQQVAVFFEGADATTVLHEYFHHVQAIGLMPTALQRALNNSFGDIDDLAMREEREAEAFTRYLVEGVLPDGADPRLAQAFDYLRRTGNAFYEKAKTRWKLPDNVKAEMDRLFTGADYDFQTEAVGEATLASLENDKSVNMMAIRREPTKMGFHMAKSNFASINGVSEVQVREMLKAAGMKGYILAKDDPSKQQDSDMTDDELAEATEYLAEKNASLRQSRKFSKQREESARRWGGEEEQKAVQDILGHLQTIPDKSVDRQDYEGGTGFVKAMTGRIKRAVKHGLSKVSTHWNIEKMLDGGLEDGPFQRIFGTRLVDGENLKAEALDRIENVITTTYARLGGKEALSQPTDLTTLINVGGVNLQAAKVASIYIMSEGGNPDSKWGRALMERNEEVTSQGIIDAAKYVNSPEGKSLKNYIEVVRAVMKHIQPELDQTAKSIGLDGVGSLGDWYLPFISEDGYRAQTEWEDLLSSVSPLAQQRGERGVRRPSQIQSRADMENVQDEQIRMAMLQSMGRLNLNIDELFSRYIESSANYIGKAQNVKMMTKVLENPMVRQAASQKGNGEFYEALNRMVRREMYPSGRETPMNSGERALQYVRSYSTLSMLGYRITSGLRQFPSIGVGWAAYVTRPRDVVRSLSLAYKAFSHGNGIDKLTKTFSRQPLKGLEAYDEMIADHPALKYRSFEPEHRDMARTGIGILDPGKPIDMKAKGFFKKFVKHSMDHIRFIDSVVVSSVYKSAKDHQMEILNAAVERGDMTPAEAMRSAADFALRVVDKTQNPSGLTQRALIQTESEFMKALNPFSGQRFINFNYYIYDVLMPIVQGVSAAEGGFAKAGAVFKGTWDHKKQLAFAWAVPAIMFGMIARRRLPEDEEEVLVDLLMYPFASVPVVGSLLQSYVSGKFQDYAYDPTMIGAMARSASTSIDAAMRLTGMRKGSVDWNDANQVRRLVSVMTRTPEYPTQVLQNFIREVGWEGKEEGNVMLRIFQMKVEPTKPKPLFEEED